MSKDVKPKKLDSCVQLDNVLNNQQLLAKNLTHEIHTEDETLDHGLENIHHESDDEHSHWEVIHKKDLNKHKK